MVTSTPISTAHVAFLTVGITLAFIFIRGPFENTPRFLDSSQQFTACEPQVVKELGRSTCQPWSEFVEQLAMKWPQSDFDVKVPASLEDFWRLQHQLWFAEGWNRMPDHQAVKSGKERAGTFNVKFLGQYVQKYPTDMWLYQELFYELMPDLVIECGTYNGGASAYYAMLLSVIKPEAKVITVDYHANPGDPTFYKSFPFVQDRVTYLQKGDGDLDPELFGIISAEAAKAKTVIVFLDADHTRSHVLQQLKKYSSLVKPVGSYLIVEDTNIDGNPVCIKGLNKHCGGTYEGPDEGLKSWLPTQDSFEVDRKWENIMHITQQPGGWLRRVK